MISFEYAPAVPITYEKVRAAFVESEQQEAIRFGYVTPDSGSEFLPAGSSSYNKRFEVSSDIRDWRNRMLLVWFCFIWENIHRIPRPLAALEEILFELQGGLVDFNKGRVRLSVVYAGAAAREPLSSSDRDEERKFLEPYYRNAIKLLEDYCRVTRS